jgi:hypothetical protein
LTADNVIEGAEHCVERRAMASLTVSQGVKREGPVGQAGTCSATPVLRRDVGAALPFAAARNPPPRLSCLEKLVRPLRQRVRAGFIQTLLGRDVAVLTHLGSLHLANQLVE